MHGKAFAAALVWAFCWQSATAILRQAEPQYSAAVGGEHSLPIPSRRRYYCSCSFVRAELLTTGRMWLSHVVGSYASHSAWLAAASHCLGRDGWLLAAAGWWIWLLLAAASRQPARQLQLQAAYSQVFSQ